MIRVSPSRVKLAHSCLRRWAARELFRHEDARTFAAARGVMFHATMARRALGLPYDYETVLASLTVEDAWTVSPFRDDPRLRDVVLRLANAIHIDPPPTVVEYEVTVDVDGVTWTGRLDAARFEPLIDAAIVIDYKTTSDAKYAMTKDELTSDLQACFYGLAALRGALPFAGTPSKVIADWRYAESRSFTALPPVGALLTETRCLDVLRRYRPTVDKMLELEARFTRRELSLQDIPLTFDPNDVNVERPCEAYFHTCAFIRACQPPPVPIEVLARAFASKERGDMTQSHNPYPQYSQPQPVVQPQPYPQQQLVSPYPASPYPGATIAPPGAGAYPPAPTPAPQYAEPVPQQQHVAPPVEAPVEVPAPDAEEKVPGRGRPRKPRASKTAKPVVSEDVAALDAQDVDVIQEPADGPPEVASETPRESSVNITEALTVMAAFAREQRVAFTLTPVGRRE